VRFPLDGPVWPGPNWLEIDDLTVTVRASVLSAEPLTIALHDCRAVIPKPRNGSIYPAVRPSRIMRVRTTRSVQPDLELTLVFARPVQVPPARRFIGEYAYPRSAARRGQVWADGMTVQCRDRAAVVDALVARGAATEDSVPAAFVAIYGELDAPDRSERVGRAEAKASESTLKGCALVMFSMLAALLAVFGGGLLMITAGPDDGGRFWAALVVIVIVGLVYMGVLLRVGHPGHRDPAWLQRQPPRWP